MGIWGFIDAGKKTVKRYTPGPVKQACNASYSRSAAAVKKIDDVVRVNGLQKLGQYIPDDEGRAKIVSFSTKLVKNASVYAVKEAATYILPGGKAVTKIYTETVREVETECRKKQDRSCIKEITGDSNKDSTGSAPPPGLLDGAEMLELGCADRGPKWWERAHSNRVREENGNAIVSAVDESLKNVSGGSKIVKEGLRDQSPSRPRLDNHDLTVMMEEMQAKMEKLQDDVYSTKQQNETAAKCANGLDSFEFSDEPIKSSTPTKPNRKKVFIRSRL